MDLIIFLKKKCKPLEVLCLNKIMTHSNFNSPSRDLHMDSYAYDILGGRKKPPKIKNSWGGKRIESKIILRNHYLWCKANGRDVSWYNK